MSKINVFNSVASIQWSIGATLLNTDGSKSLGFAGTVNGVSNDVLIIAGGANFPDKMPWEGGKKYYSDQIRVFEEFDAGFTLNEYVVSRLPEPIAYCGNTSTDYGIVYVGGENENGISASVFILTWNASRRQVEVKNLPSLPLALVNAGVTQINNVVYVVGGDTSKCSSSEAFRLNLNNEYREWEQLPDLPKAIANIVTVAQNSREGVQVYAIGGRTKTDLGISDLHHTTFAFNPSKNTWTECASISDGINILNLSAGIGLAHGKNNIILTGGDDGTVFNQIETYLAKIAKATNTEEKKVLIDAKNQLILNHKGFYKGVLIYDTLKDSWCKIGNLSYPAQVTTTGIKWNQYIVLPTGEIKPGVRTPNIIIGKTDS